MSEEFDENPITSRYKLIRHDAASVILQLIVKKSISGLLSVFN
jgi:hypothetical protein